MKAIALHSIVPVRAEEREGSEQLTQLLFAETVEILEEKPRWIRIKNDADGQIGWVDFKMLTRLSKSEEDCSNCNAYGVCSERKQRSDHTFDSRHLFT